MDLRKMKLEYVLDNSIICLLFQRKQSIPVYRIVWGETAPRI